MHFINQVNTAKQNAISPCAFHMMTKNLFLVLYCSIVSCILSNVMFDAISNMELVLYQNLALDIKATFVLATLHKSHLVLSLSINETQFFITYFTLSCQVFHSSLL